MNAAVYIQAPRDGKLGRVGHRSSLAPATARCFAMSRITGHKVFGRGPLGCPVGRLCRQGASVTE